MTTTPPRPPADSDAVYRAYFHAERPAPWPWPEASADTAPQRFAEPRRTGWDLAAARSRLTLAASVLFVLAAGLVLAPRMVGPSGGSAATRPGMLRDAGANGKDAINVVVPPHKPKP